MHTLPELGYAYDALEPHIDAKTMEIHHTKHHLGYVNKLNTALESKPELAEKPLEALLKELNSLELDESTKTAIRNNGGGHTNHTLFWSLMNPNAQKDESLVAEINDTFGSVDEMKTKFNENAGKRFGSGWSWLVRNNEGKLELYSTPNQDSPLLQGHTPIIGLDVWEHAYYLNYQNKRPDYIEAWWKLVKIV